MRTMFLYGIGGSMDQYRVLRYIPIEQEDISVMTLKYKAMMLKDQYPSIKRVFAMDNSRELYADYWEAYKKNSIESHLIFKDLLEREGIEIKI